MSWLGKHWKYQRTLVIQGSLVKVTETDFLVKYELSNLDTDFFSKVGATADSIRVTGLDGTTLVPHWVSNYHQVNKTGTLYYLTDTVFGASKSHILYYGNPFAETLAPADSNGREAVVADYAAYWPFDINADDITANANHGTVNGATLVTPGHLGGGEYDFDGVNDYINVPDDNSLDAGNGGQVVIEFWWTPDLTSGDGYSDIISKRGGSNTNYGINVNPDGGTDLFQVYLQDSLAAFQALTFSYSGNFSNGQKHHVVALFNDNGADIDIECWVNGSSRGSTTITGENLITDTNPVRIGGNSTGVEWMDGSVDNMSIRTDKIYGLQEVLTRYNNQVDTGLFVISGSEIKRSSEGTFKDPREKSETFFHGYKRGVYPSDSIVRWSGNQTPTVEDDLGATEGTVLQFPTGGAAKESFHTIGQILETFGGGRQQVVARVRADNWVNGETRIWFRANDNDLDKNGFAFFIDASTVGFFRFLGDAFSLVGSTHSFTPTDDVWYWVRAEIDGHSIDTIDLRANIWSGNYIDEPAGWMVERTSTDAINFGRIGVGRSGTTATLDFDVFNIAIDDDALEEFPGYKSLGGLNRGFVRNAYRPIQSSEVGGTGGELNEQRLLLTRLNAPQEARTIGDPNEAQFDRIALTRDSDGKIRIPAFTLVLKNNVIPNNSNWQIPYKIRVLDQDVDTDIYLWYNWQGNPYTVGDLGEFEKFNVSPPEYENTIPGFEDPNSGAANAYKDITSNARHADGDSTMTSAGIAELTEGIEGYDLDGTDDFITGDNFDLPSDDFTLWCIAKRDDTGRGALIATHDGSGNNQLVFIIEDSNAIAIIVNAVLYTFTGVTAPADGLAHLYVVTGDESGGNTTCTLYIDGVNEDSSSLADKIPDLSVGNPWVFWQEYDGGSESDWFDGPGAWCNIMNNIMSDDEVLTLYNGFLEPLTFIDNSQNPAGIGGQPKLPVDKKAFLTARIMRFAIDSVTSTEDLKTDQSSFGDITIKLEDNATKLVYGDLPLQTYQLDEGFFADYSDTIYYLIEVQYGTIWDDDTSRVVFMGVIDRDSIHYDKPSASTTFQCLSIDKLLGMSPKISPRGGFQMVLDSLITKNADMVVQRDDKSLLFDTFDETITVDRIHITKPGGFGGDLEFQLTYLLDGSLMVFNQSLNDNIGDVEYRGIVISYNVNASDYEIKTSLFTNDEGAEDFVSCKKHYKYSEFPISIDAFSSDWRVRIHNINLHRNPEAYVKGIFTLYNLTYAGSGPSDPDRYDWHVYQIDSYDLVENGIEFVLNQTVGSPDDIRGFGILTPPYSLQQAFDTTDIAGKTEVRFYSGLMYGQGSIIHNESDWITERNYSTIDIVKGLFNRVPVLQHFDTAVQTFGTVKSVSRLAILSDEPGKAFGEIQRDTETLAEFTYGLRQPNGLRQLILNLYTREYLAAQDSIDITVPITFRNRVVANSPVTVVTGGPIINRAKKNDESFGWYSVDEDGLENFTQFADDIPNNDDVIKIDKSIQPPGDVAFYDGEIRDFYYNDDKLREAAKRFHIFYSAFRIKVSFQLQGIFDNNLGKIIREQFQNIGIMVLGVSTDYGRGFTKIDGRVGELRNPAIYMYLTDVDSNPTEGSGIYVQDLELLKTPVRINEESVVCRFMHSLHSEGKIIFVKDDSKNTVRFIDVDSPSTVQTFAVLPDSGFVVDIAVDHIREQVLVAVDNAGINTDVIRVLDFNGNLVVSHGGFHSLKGVGVDAVNGHAFINSNNFWTIGRYIWPGFTFDQNTCRFVSANIPSWIEYDSKTDNLYMEREPSQTGVFKIPNGLNQVDPQVLIDSHTGGDQIYWSDRDGLIYLAIGNNGFKRIDTFGNGDETVGFTPGAWGANAICVYNPP